MAAFAGIFDLEARREIDRGRLRRMAEAMVARAPTRPAFEIEPGVGLVLRPSPAEAASEPGLRRTRSGSLFGSDGRPVLAISPAAELAALGRPVDPLSSGALLAELFDLRGADALSGLEGAFSLGAYSARDGALLLARDRFGEKPLYYTETREGFLVFASDHRAILASGLVHAVPEDRLIADTLFYGYLPSPGTPFTSIEELPPGHALLARRGRPLSAARPWDTPLAAEPAGREHETPEQAGRAVAAGLSVAVRRAAAAPCRFVALSAGPGAPALGCAAAPHAARAASAQLQGSAESLAQPLIQAFGEPFCDPAALALSACLQGLEAGTSVLTDDGAEELFAGHARYAASPAGGIAVPAIRFRAHARRGALLPRRTVRRLLAAPLSEAVPEARFDALAKAQHGPPARACLVGERRMRLPGRTLKLTDRLGAAHGLKIVRPFLDSAVTALADDLTRDRPASGAAALTVAGHGFEEGGLGAIPSIPCPSLAEAVLKRTHWRDSGLFDVDAAEKIARRREGAERRQILWSLLMIDLFLETL